MMKKRRIGLSRGKDKQSPEKENRLYFRRYQDFYLLEQKLTEFHGVFSDARLPTRRSAATARNLEFLESIKRDFEHFLRVRNTSPSIELIFFCNSLAFVNQTNIT
jgi:hypothetical protein